MAQMDVMTPLETVQEPSAAIGLAAASHDIRQPAAVIVALAEAALVTAVLPPTAQWYLERIIDEATTIGDIARSTLSNGADDIRRERRVDVTGVADDILATFGLVWAGTARRAGDDELYITADPVLVRRALMNLVDNAVRAAGSNGRICVRAERRRDVVEISVEDSGPGFGLIESRTNMGLAVAEQLLTKMRGTLTIGTSAALGGASVTLRMPVLSESCGGGSHALGVV